MVIDFSKIDFKEKPTLVLRNADGKAIQTLGYAHNLNAEIRYNETSTITFELPAYVNKQKTPHYDDVVGMRIIDMLDWGQFILMNPSTTNDGIKEVKSCKAYSLEYELTYKKMSLEEGTYNFYNPVTPNDTIIGIILSYLPSWSIGEIDSKLIDKYRTFEESNVNIYNFIKSTVQDTYGCIFDFDTYKRKINVKSTSSSTSTAPVYISFDNLAKEIEIEEDSENIFTVLDVNGADGVTIRSVNPMGTNKIYNLDYYMNSTNFSDDMIEKWNSWKSTYESAQRTYYNITIEKMSLTSSILSKENELNELKNQDLAKLENQQSVYIEYLATLSDTDSDDYSKYKRLLKEVNSDIKSLKSDISDLQDEIDELKTQKDSVTEDLVSINNETSFSNFFSDDELKILNRYFKEDAISDSSFVIGASKSYSSSDVSGNVENCSYSITNSDVTDVEFNEKTFFTISGGTLSVDGDDFSLNASIIKATVEYRDDDFAVFSCYLSKGTINGESFASGTLTAMGDVYNLRSGSSKLSFECSDSKNYFTKNTTDYEQYSVEWELYEYGMDCLNKLAYPSYSFSVDTANFFMLEEFQDFVKKTVLGDKIYLSLDDNRVLEPILIGANIDFENLTSMDLEFGDTFNLSSNTFNLVDLLDQSISMGKTVDSNRFNYNSFIDSGAATAVKGFMDSSLDVAKNAILSSIGMAISWDSSGIKCRKWKSDGSDYEPEQLAIINNNIVFTDDAWETAKMAIGHFSDTNAGNVWGIVAPSIVGTLLAGKSMIIESEKKSGDISVFRVDANGAFLHNADFNITTDNNTQIMLNPDLGIAIGKYPLYTEDGNGNKSLKKSNAVFYVDADGDMFLKGVIQADDFLDGAGESMLEVVDGIKTGKFDSKYLSLYGLEIKKGSRTTLEITRSGDLMMSGDLVSSTIHGGSFYGGKYCATGEGRYDQAAYYIYSGSVTDSDGYITPTGLVGYISYDSNGAGTSDEAKQRVFFTTLNNTALKINASGNMSISTGGTLYIDSNVNFANHEVTGLKVTFG